ncbi:MAG: peptidylprolyl isomerase [Armatimonadota bacterium]|nr:peptidylprolyl isomerase [bacterium]
MAQAKQGDCVKVDYTGKLKDGSVFDTSENREPLEFTIGGGQIIPDFELAVLGMNPGDSKTIDVPAARAYGPHHEDMVISVDRKQFPEDISPEVGEQLEIRQSGGQSAVVTVTEVNDESVILDANHPLAGKDLIFDIQLVEICC